MAALTAAGRIELNCYWAQMELIRKHATQSQTFERNGRRGATTKLSYANAIKSAPA
jgi:hypothetical protein